MFYCRLLLLITLLGSLVNAAPPVPHHYAVPANSTTSITLAIPTQVRLSLFQYCGQVSLTLVSEHKTTTLEPSQPLDAWLIAPREGSVDLVIGASKEWAEGTIELSTLETVELVPHQSEKLMKFQPLEARIIEIHPTKHTKLSIERMFGRVTLLINRCMIADRYDCMAWLDRYDPNPMPTRVETLELQSCQGCMVLVKLWAGKNGVGLRVSTGGLRKVLAWWPMMAKVGENQKIKVGVCGKIGEGRVLRVSGKDKEKLESESTGLESNKVLRQYNLDKVFQSHPNISTEQAILELQGSSSLSPVLVSNPSSSNRIHLMDGLPSSHFFQPSTTYYLTYHRHKDAKANIAISASTQMIPRLRVTFTQETLNQHYIIHPRMTSRLTHNNSHMTQSFQIDQTEQDIRIELRIVGDDEGGWFDLVSLSEEVLTLGVGWRWAGVLGYGEETLVVVEGMKGPVEVMVNRCVECQLQVGVYQETIGRGEETSLKQLTRNITRVLQGQTLFIRIKTNNYAYYQLSIQDPSQTQHALSHLPSRKIDYYLTEDDKLQLDFSPPSCDPSPCKHVKYYLFQGSDAHMLTSQVYCPHTLFDFDTRSDDVVLEEITPKASSERLSIVRQFKHKDYIAIVAQVGTNSTSQGLAYSVVNTEEVRLYRSMRWPFFYLALFVTAAAFCSFMLFMNLRRKRHVQDDLGYQRMSSAASLEQVQ